MKKENFDLFGNVALVEEFISEKFDLRYNVLSGHVEMSGKPMTERDKKDLILAARSEFEGVSGVKSIVSELLGSNRIAEYNPASAFLDSLPKWDGVDHVEQLLCRIPGLSSEQKRWMRIWLRSMVNQWREDTELYGNQCVLTLIGAQGCRKSTFLQTLLPENLRQYYLDNINLSNAFSRDMALTNNLLVNIDEMDQIKATQQAELKYNISRPVVNGRPIYGRTQICKKRYASFAATTNSPHPLQDATGSRRFICIQIPTGQIIDVETPIDYGQLYAQIVDELDNQKLISWFTDQEVALIQEFNTQFQSKSDLCDMLDVCFRKPLGDEETKEMSLKEIVDTISAQFPNIAKQKSTDIKLGLILKQEGFEHVHTRNGNIYNVIPIVA